MEIQSPLLTGGIFALLGLVFAFFGYRLMRSLVRIQTALIFASVVIEIAVESGWSPWIGFGAALGAGILGYLLGDFMYYVNVFLMGAFVGIIVTFVAVLAAGMEVSLAWILIGGVLGSVVGGGLALLFQRPVGIFLTSLMGGALLVFGGCMMITGKAVKDLDGWMLWVAFGSIAALTVMACVVQGRSAKEPQGLERGDGHGPQRSNLR